MKALIILTVIVFSVFSSNLMIYLYFKKRENRRIESLQNMIDLAVKGTLPDVHFDENKLSVLENSLKHYLTSCEHVAGKLKEQKELVETLITDISHQSTTPISNILLYSELLEEQESCASEEITAIKEQAQKLDFLIQSLVKLSRLETGIITVNIKEENINSILLGLKRQFTSKAEKRGVTLQIYHASILANFDLKWTLEAVSNIVDNAIKYTPKNGSVTVKAIQYHLFARIDVIDTGIGIAQEEQNKIFGRFYRSLDVEESPGSGIGLFLSRQIIQMEEGYIKVESKKHCGSVFSVFLPL